MDNKILNKLNKKVIISIIIAIVVIALIGVSIIIYNIMSKPSEKKATELINTYIQAMTEADGQLMIQNFDVEANTILEQEGERKFAKNYKDKDEYIQKYLKENNYENIDELKNNVVTKFESSYGYYQYELKEIKSIEKSDKCKKIIVVRAKVKLQSKYYSRVDTARFYLLKVDGQYKIIDAEI